MDATEATQQQQSYVDPAANQAKRLEEKAVWSRGVLPAERKTAQGLRDRQRAKPTQPKRNGRLKTESDKLPHSQMAYQIWSP